MKKEYVIYDGRAVTQGTDEATVLSVASSLKEARRDARETGYSCAIYEYDVDDSTNPPQLLNERFVEGHLG